MTKEDCQRLTNMETILQQILDRLTTIESKVDYMANPLSQISAEEKGDILRVAIATGDRRKVREAARLINGS